MLILGRRPARLLSAALRIPEFLRAAVRCAQLFESPGRLLVDYIRRRTPRGGRLQLRDGLVIHLSNDFADVVTVFLIFCRRDYGRVERGSCVVDVGANIGVFVLYAAWSGAARVEAYEPAAESHAVLTRNVADNDLTGIVTIHRAAVVGRPVESVWFPRASSVFNAPVSDAAGQEGLDKVPAVRLADVLAVLRGVDLLKLDCEGGEYDILLHSDPAIFSRVGSIKLEYHRGPHEQLMRAVSRLGYQRRQFMDEGEGGGYLWLVR